jgi:transcriptional regulator with XRE-family HTH domain
VAHSKSRGLDNKIGSVIRRERIAQGLSQAELCQKVGISLGLLGSIERGTSSPSFAVVAEIFHVLGLDLEAVTSELRYGLTLDARLDRILGEAGFDEPDRERFTRLRAQSKEILLHLLGENATATRS